MLQASITASSPVSIGSTCRVVPTSLSTALRPAAQSASPSTPVATTALREPDERPREEPPALPAHPALGLESSSGSRFQTRANASAYASTRARGCGAMGYVWEKRQSERSTMDWVTGNWSSA